MPANWSVLLNVLFLVGVLIAIARILKAKRQEDAMVSYQPSVGQPVEPTRADDIIAVRKISLETDAFIAHKEPVLRPKIPTSAPVMRVEAALSEPEREAPVEEEKPISGGPALSSLILFLLAKENRQLAGYELLQTVLSVGLRFGEGHLFHRHQFPNGQGPVLCSLAAATPSGVFDLQNIGAFSVHGLCLFMQTSGNPTIDAERFAIMLDTAKQLSEGLDTYLLDDRRQPLTEAGIRRYYQRIDGVEACEFA